MNNITRKFIVRELTTCAQPHWVMQLYIGDQSTNVRRIGNKQELIEIAARLNSEEEQDKT